jgi:A/G-specific adenine glycosylase
MQPLSPTQIKHFQKKILTWYEEHQRDLPWRKTRDPYHILVSEIMLQQTQVTRVIPKFEAWLSMLPTVKELAVAPTVTVLTLWSGLGYNRRALNLKKTAQIISEKYDGRFPQNEKALMALPGIGIYTARAVLCFAFDQQVAVVDTNVKKVILTQLFRSFPEEIRLGDGSSTQNDLKIDEKMIMTIAEQILPHGKAYEWNQALMDYSSTVLKKEKIHIPKQSKFIGSRRYYRGRVLKVLLEKKSVPIEELGSLIKNGFAAHDQEWLEKLLGELINEGFIVNEKNSIRLMT